MRSGWLLRSRWPIEGEPLGEVEAQANAFGLEQGASARLEAKWARGTFASEQESINRHYLKHGAGRTLEEYTNDALKFWETNKGEAQWGRWNPKWEPSYRLEVGSEKGYYTADGRILSYWGEPSTTPAVSLGD